MRLFNYLKSPLYDAFDDMPAAPGVPAGTAVPVDSSGDADMFEGVPTMGEALPIGTYHFRLEKVSSGANKVEESAGVAKLYSNGNKISDQPWYMLQWVCQQEPHTGRQFGDFCPWVNKECRDLAKTGDVNAQILLKDRLWKAKAVLEAAGYKPSGAFDIDKDFFSTHPEVKIQLGIQPGKTKDPVSKKYIEDGSTQNKAIKYLSLTRPA